MKEFLEQKGPYIKKEKDQFFPSLMIVLVFMMAFRFVKEGMIPYFQGKILWIEFFLPLLLMASCILLTFGCFYMGRFFGKDEYSQEECLIDGILLGLLIPLHTSIFALIFSAFLMVLLGRYVFSGTLFPPICIGLICSIFLNFNTFQVSLEETSLSSIWLGLSEESRYSPLLCMIAFLFLMIKKTIKWRIPVYFLGSYIMLLVISNLFFPTDFVSLLKQLGSYDLLFLVIFVVSDQKMTPVTTIGQILFSLLLALFIYLISYFLNPFFSMIVSILLLNGMVPLFDYFGNYYQLKFCNQFENF